jgi:hypothetical protein
MRRGRRGLRRGRRGLRSGDGRGAEEEPEDEQEEEQEEEKEEDYQTKGMYAVALVKTCVSLITNYSFTVYRWMEKTTTKNWKLKRNLDVEEKVEYETKCTSTIEHL